MPWRISIPNMLHISKNCRLISPVGAEAVAISWCNLMEKGTFLRRSASFDVSFNDLRLPVNLAISGESACIFAAQGFETGEHSF